MNLTNEEKDKIFNGVRQIEEYLKELQTQIYKPIFAYFDAWFDGTTSTDKVYIGKDFIYIGVEHGKNIYFDINDTNKPNWYSKLFMKCIYDDVLFALYLIVNWEYIKKQLTSKINSQNEKQKRVVNAINNFVL